jgi:periplasmic divalent cation tolerance protein
MSGVVVLTTLGASADARAFARPLVESRLAACVNILPRISSVYRWEGEVVEEDEQLLVIKTSSERVDALRTALLSTHPYDVPEFVVLEIAEMSEAYGKWLLGEVE